MVFPAKKTVFEMAGPRKNETKKIVAELEKAGRKTKQKIWIAIAVALKKPRRNRPSINLWKLEKLAKKFKGNTLVVPGKVLGYGSLEEKTSVAALEFSEKAKKEIESKGKAMSLNELLKSNEKVENLVIVK